MPYKIGLHLPNYPPQWILHVILKREISKNQVGKIQAGRVHNKMAATIVHFREKLRDFAELISEYYVNNKIATH